MNIKLTSENFSIAKNKTYKLRKYNLFYQFETIKINMSISIQTL